MTNEEVKAIVANPYISPEDLVKHYLSNPMYLEEWLRAKGKALAGLSANCQQCVISTYLQEMLTKEGWEFEYLESSDFSIEWAIDSSTFTKVLPEWTRKYITAIDSHRNGKNPYDIKNRKPRIFSGNLAANILKVTLAAGVE